MDLEDWDAPYPTRHGLCPHRILAQEVLPAFHRQPDRDRSYPSMASHASRSGRHWMNRVGPWRTDRPLSTLQEYCLNLVPVRILSPRRTLSRHSSAGVPSWINDGYADWQARSASQKSRSHLMQYRTPSANSRPQLGHAIMPSGNGTVAAAFEAGAGRAGGRIAAELGGGREGLTVEAAVRRSPASATLGPRPAAATPRLQAADR
jgi:hypothetical protein